MRRFRRPLHNLSPASAIVLALLMVVAFATSASADAPDSGDSTTTDNGARDDVTTVRLGLGGLALPDFEGAKDYSVFPVPIVEISNWHRFNLSFRGLSYQLYRYRNDAESEFKKIEFRLEPMIRPSASRKEDSEFLFFTRGDNHYLRGLGDIDTGLDVGANLFLRTGPVAAQLELRQEIAGGHEGFTAKLGLGTRIPFSERTRLGIEAATTWANDTYMDAFFSIDRRQAYRSIYHHYDANADFKDASLGLRLDYDFNDRVSLISMLRYSRLLGDAADSPIVEGPGGSADQFTALVGLTYRWTF